MTSAGYLDVSNKERNMLHVKWFLQKTSLVSFKTTDTLIIKQPVIGDSTYRKVSNIRRTKSPNLNVPHLVLQLSLPNPMKPVVKSRMKM